MTTIPHPLTDRQLETLLDLRHISVLRALRTPATASALARTLKLPKPLVHYRINKLLEVGLLRIREKTSRGRVFETVYETFSVPKTLVGTLGEELPAMLETLLNRVYREFFSEFEKMSLALSTFDEEGDMVTMDLERNFGVEGERLLEETRFHYTPRAVVTTVRLSEANYDKVAQRLNDVISDAQDETDGEPCTFAMLGYRGGSLR